jgi:hypothetical protein
MNARDRFTACHAHFSPQKTAPLIIFLMNACGRYTANVVSALVLFDAIGPDWADPTDLLALSDGTSMSRADAYERARDIAITWQQDSPEKTQVG